MSRYVAFWGCVIPYQLPYIEAVTRKSLDRLGVELVDEPQFGCCPDPIGIQALDHTTWLALAARNLCLAEARGLDILSPCSGCYETLKEANSLLKENAARRNEINGILSEVGKRFEGRISVKHLIEVLYTHIGPARIAASVQRPLKGIKVAVHYGCHLVRPSRVLQFGDPEDPSSLDELVEAIGARSVPYVRKMFCCGAGVNGVDRAIGLAIAREKLKNVKRAGLDCMVLACPACVSQYDRNQRAIGQAFGEEYAIPVFHYSELLCLALGMPPEELGLDLHRTSVKPVLEKLQRQAAGGTDR